MPDQVSLQNSNRLFSAFLQQAELERVNYISYFPVLEDAKQVSLLPSDHALYYPLVFNPLDGRVISGELNFFNSVLLKNYSQRNVLPPSRAAWPVKPAARRSALIVNICDNCYGHSFLKLLNLYNIWNTYSGQFDIWVFTPVALSHFVPADFYSLQISLGFNDAMKCYSFHEQIEKLRSMYESVDFVTLDTYSVFNSRKEVASFFPFTNKALTGHSNYVTFYYRSDYFRTWGGSSQADNISGFFKQLRRYFSSQVQFVVVGDKDAYTFPGHVLDKRTNAFGRDVDLEYNTIFTNSAMVIGLIGSNMLQPSMFCDFTIHLVPRAKVSIVAEEFLNSNGESIPAWFNNIYIFGNEMLDDISPGELAEKVIVLYYTYLAKCYKKNIFTDAGFAKRLSQKQFIQQNYPYFDWELAHTFKNKIADNSFRKSMWGFRLSRILRKIKLKK